MMLEPVYYELLFKKNRQSLGFAERLLFVYLSTTAQTNSRIPDRGYLAAPQSVV